MNTTATFSSDHSWSRRCSTETVFSIQGKETDYARDTSDTEAAPVGDSDNDSDADVEYEPVTEPEDDPPVDGDTSEHSDKDIIATKVIEVSVGDDGELQFADSERTDTYESDSEMDLHDYWHCAQCRNENNNPLYRYCQKCFQVRKNYFPPRPKRKRNKETKLEELPRTFSQDSGVDSPLSQLSQDNLAGPTADTHAHSTKDRKTSSPKPKPKRNKETKLSDIPRTSSQDSGVEFVLSQFSQQNPGEGTSNTNTELAVSKCNKRRGDFSDYEAKRRRVAHTDSDTDLSSDDCKSTNIVQPLVKTVSDPAITIDDVDLKITKKVIADTLMEKIDSKDLCIICITEPKSGVFVHGRIAHICCCYKCAVKVWVKAKRCPVCNCKVTNVLKAVVA